MKREHILLLIALLTGFTTLVIELCCAGFMNSYFGHYIYSWTSILLITMIGLTVGYFLGSYLSIKYENSLKILIWQIIILAISTGLISILSYQSLEYFYDKHIGVYFAGCFFLLFPMIMSGTFIPVLVSAIHKKERSNGRLTAKILGFSSFGGILGAFCTGFWFLPSFGNISTLMVTALVLLLPAIIIIGLLKEPKMFLAIVFALVIIFTSFMEGKVLYNSRNHQVIFKKEGIMGQVMVESKVDGLRRKTFLYIDRLPQSIINPVTYISYYNYVHKISGLASVFPDSSNALVLGMGAGSSVVEFVRLGFKVDALELDPAVLEAANDFCGLTNFKFNPIVDDARHYTRTSKKRYKVILMDVLNGEYTPSHLFTQEGFKELLNLLDDDGLLFIYFFGPLRGEKSMALNSIIKSVVDENVFIHLYKEKTIEEGMKILKVSKKEHLVEMDSSRINYCCRRYWNSFESAELKIKEDAHVLNDDVPLLDILYPQSFPDYKVRKMYWSDMNVTDLDQMKVVE